jgi:hypothetical protein
MLCGSHTPLAAPHTEVPAEEALFLLGLVAVPALPALGAVTAEVPNGRCLVLGTCAILPTRLIALRGLVFQSSLINRWPSPTDRHADVLDHLTSPPSPARNTRTAVVFGDELLVAVANRHAGGIILAFVQLARVRFSLAQRWESASGAYAPVPSILLLVSAEKTDLLLAAHTRRVPLAVGLTVRLEAERIIGGLALAC